MVIHSIMDVFLAFCNLSLPLTIVVVSAGNDEVGCMIFFLPTELKVEEILNVKLIFLCSRINTEVRFGNNRHFITPPHLPTPSKVVNLIEA